MDALAARWAPLLQHSSIKDQSGDSSTLFQVADMLPPTHTPWVPIWIVCQRSSGSPYRFALPQDHLVGQG